MTKVKNNLTNLHILYTYYKIFQISFKYFQEASHEKNAGLSWLLFCAAGLVTSLTLYGIVLEYVTIGGKKLNETSFIFVTTSIYTVTAYFARWIFGEKPSDISKYQVDLNQLNSIFFYLLFNFYKMMFYFFVSLIFAKMLVLSCTSIASTFTSIRSLRYVIFPVQVLFKSCKPVPVMIFGTILGKR